MQKTHIAPHSMPQLHLLHAYGATPHASAAPAACILRHTPYLSCTCCTHIAPHSLPQLHLLHAYGATLHASAAPAACIFHHTPFLSCTCCMHIAPHPMPQLHLLHAYCATPHASAAPAACMLYHTACLSCTCCMHSCIRRHTPCLSCTCCMHVVPHCMPQLNPNCTTCHICCVHAPPLWYCRPASARLRTPPLMTTYCQSAAVCWRTKRCAGGAKCGRV